MLVHFHYSIGRVLVGNLDWRAGWPRKRRNWTHMAATPEAWTSRVPARCDNLKSCLHERRADGQRRSCLAPYNNCQRPSSLPLLCIEIIIDRQNAAAQMARFLPVFEQRLTLMKMKHLHHVT